MDKIANEKIEGNPSLYERIENTKKGHTWDFDKPALQALQALQDALSLCNNVDNSVTHTEASTLQERYNDQKPKQDPCPVADPTCQGAELISRDLKYLNGIGEDLTGWTLWKRIEQGKEHRFAIDAAGVIRWERTYTQTAILNEGNFR